MGTGLSSLGFHGFSRFAACQVCKLSLARICSSLILARYAVELAAYIGGQLGAKIGGRSKLLWSAKLGEQFHNLDDLTFILGAGWTTCIRQNALDRDVKIGLHPQMHAFVQIKYSSLTLVWCRLQPCTCLPAVHFGMQ
jgi:hypothetical protein